MIPLVLLPGMMCDARLFAPQIDEFSAERDLFLARLDDSNTIEGLALRVLAEAPSKFALCGLSMGGIVAMEILRLAPERVERIALLDTNHLPERQEIASRRLRQIELVRSGKLREVLQNDMKPNYLSNDYRRDEILQLCMDMALKLGPEVFEAQSNALMNRHDQFETLRQASLPALVLCGQNDRLCPVERHEQIAGIMNGSRLVVVEDAGHLPTLEQPERTNAAMRDWLLMS